MADAVSPKEAEFMEWLKSSAWSDWRHHATNKAALFDAFEAGERKERERCAKVAESFLGELSPEVWPPHGLAPSEQRFDHGAIAKAAKNIARVIRGGESTDAETTP